MAAAELLRRAWEIAGEIAARPPLMVRYTRVALTQRIKQLLLADLGYGLVLDVAAQQR